ncbi:MAG: hypothetical protein GX346_04840 [Clostridiales bacterium]|nr:hypothetical protein [Clostridiales bacterium]
MIFYASVIFLLIILVEIVPFFKEKNKKDGIKASIVLLFAMIPAYLFFSNIKVYSPMYLMYELFMWLGWHYPALG